MLTAYIALLLCISPHVPEDDATAFAYAAEARGYELATSTGPECAVTLVPSDSDWADASMLGYDDGTLDGGRPQPLTVDRAADLLTAWESRL